MCQRNTFLELDKLTKEDWINLRKKGIGGSDAGAICGVNPYSSAISVFKAKVSKDFTEIKDNEAMRQGRDLEGYVASRFEEATGLKTFKSPYIYFHPKYNWMFANIDRWVEEGKIGLECKTTSKGENYNNNEIPSYYLCQIYHYLAVTEAEAWWFCCLIFGKGLFIKKIERDEQIIKDLISIEKNFWENNIIKGIMPLPDGSIDINNFIDSLYPSSKEGTEIKLFDYDSKLKIYLNLSEEIKNKEKEREQIKQEIQLEMKEIERAYTENYIVNWKNIKVNRFDSKKFQEENPDLYQNYNKEFSYRRFEVKKKEEN